MKAVGASGESLSDDFHQNGRAYDSLVWTLSVLLGSKNPFEECARDWKIDRVEDDPVGYLPWFMWRSSRSALFEGEEDIVFGTNETKVVLEHMRFVDIENLDEQRLMEALSVASFDSVLRSEMLSDPSGALTWFQDARTELLGILRILAQNEGSRLDIY